MHGAICGRSRRTNGTGEPVKHALSHHTPLVRVNSRKCTNGGKISCIEGTKLSERSGILDDDPFGARHPTSHERLTGLPWDASYHDGPAPWDIGQPQPAIVRVAREGGFAGAVLDAGCGTGENALHVASLVCVVLQ